MTHERHPGVEHLRKLLDAKDCFVRQAVLDERRYDPNPEEL